MRDERDLLAALMAADQAAGEAELFVLTYTGLVEGHPATAQIAAAA
jgi:hypothetical protein